MDRMSQGHALGIIEALQKEQAWLDAERERVLREKAAQLEAERAATQELEQQLHQAAVSPMHAPIPVVYIVYLRLVLYLNQMPELSCAALQLVCCRAYR